MMQPENRSSRATRVCVAILATLILALMSGDRPAGQGGLTTAVNFDGVNDYITFGAASGTGALGVTNFTLELSFKWTGGGTTASTGTGGLTGATAAIPLLTKGTGQAETPANLNMNYFLGISGGKLAADFEDTVNGGNHPVIGAITITPNVWHHAAATYDGTTWRLYLDGVLDTTLSLGTPFTPQSTSIQHAGLGTAMTSTGAAAGFFAGIIDEARVWNVVRSQADIVAGMNVQVTSGTGLIGRWGLNEGSGVTAANSVSGRPNGTLTGGPTWIVPDITPPAAPQNVIAGIGNALVTIAWNQSTETDFASYNVYRNGSTTPLNAAPITSPIYTDNTVTNGQTYTYVVTAVDTASNESADSSQVIAAPHLFAGAGLQFNGTNQYVTFGQATATLGATTFTLETWFKRTGAGIATSTGAGGVTAVPLITKGMAEAETPANVNMNYFLGINSTTGVLVADFEDTATGLNHPASGTIPIPVSTTAWHHAAVTYDGDEWRIYLDGVLDTTTFVGAFTPESASIQHAVIASALNSTGGIGTQTQGFFNGLLDEVRIWNYARTPGEILTGMNQEIFVGPIARWGLNEASGTTIGNTAGSATGTAMGAPRWTAGYAFPPDSVPPVPPVDLTAIAGNGQVTLGWTANGEFDLAGYNVYRRTVSTGFGTPLNGALLTSPSFIDTTVTNETQYFYAVSAVDVFNNPSALSDEATATPSTNPPPLVNAGPDRTATLSASAVLSGTASDNGPFTVLWSMFSGPGSVSFASATSASTTATFTKTGVYVLRLTANDGVKTAFDNMTVTITDPVLVGAGDIAPNCVGGNSVAPAEAVATVLDGIPGTVFTLGDNAYQDGTPAEFANCYHPTWGRHRDRTRPVTGNHDYNTPNATGYYDYFNGVGVQTGRAGNRTTGGYYSYNLGNWHIVVLNSECTALWDPNGCAAGSAQEQWLRADLASSPTNNIIAMWHRPLYSSSSPASTHAYLQPLWQVLYDYGVDIFLGGHWHNYERLAPVNASGALDNAFGIRTFVIGTGGINLGGTYPNLHPASEVRNSTTHGAMKFTLHDNSYEWEFFPIAGQSFTDSGTGTVHGAPGNQAPTVDAGTDLTVTSGAAQLNGIVTDDGPTTITWSQLSGPATATATFGNANAAATTVGFPAAGVYVLQLTVTDGQFVRSDTISITVASATGNLPPFVNAGADQSVTMPGAASLSGTITDDGSTGIDITTTWSNRSPGVGTVTFADATAAATTATFSAAGSYTLRLTADDGELSAFDELVVTVNPAETNNAIDFGGTNAYVTFGQAPGLGVSTMTIEAWFRRDGAGATAESGSSGIIATPIVAKGTSESDGSTVDLNYFMGITAAGQLAADFEDNATGANHPVTGTTTIPISSSAWHHAAATYDGTTWRLYLDGVLEATQAVGNFTPRFDSVQHGSIGSALTSTGAPEGFFAGPIDEVRVWNRALSLGEIQSNINQQIHSAPNLVARWGLNEVSGTTVTDSTADPINGTITGAAWTRVPGAPFNLVINQPPNPPVLISPTNAATGQSTSPSLNVNVSDPDGNQLDVTFFGRSAAAAPAPDFTIVALPDTQHYVDDPGRAATFTAQTNWVVNNRATLNTVFVSHLGDIVEHIDAEPVEWTRADASMDVLDNASPPVPYGIAPGNHDMSSAGVATNYDLLFPVSRMSGYPWYGGYLGQNLFNFSDPINRLNKNQFSLFSTGGMDFVVIHLEYDMPGYAVAWANRVLAAYPNRRAIIATHLFLNTSAQRPSSVLNRTTDGTSAAAVWTNLIFNNCNVFLVLNGHYPGEANRTDLNACGQPVHQLLSDYQSRTNGGDGWLRYMTFKPAENKIYVYTYSPTLAGGTGQFETDANSQFVLDYNMQGAPFTSIATNNDVNSGGNTQTSWTGRAQNTQYEWYAAVSDGVQTVNGPTWTFTTGGAVNSPPTANAQNISTNEDTQLNITLTGSDPEGTALTFTAGAPSHGTLTGTGASRTYTPAADYNGPDSFTFTVTDVGGATSAPATVSITVSPVNDGPSASAQSVTTSEDTPLSITLTGTDPEGSALTFNIVSAPTHGTVSSGTGAARTYTPAANYNGPDSFTFTVSDGSLTSAPATVSITVSPVNDGPTATPQSVTTNEDTQLGITLAGSDPDGSALTFNIVTAPTQGTLSSGTGAARTYTPGANYNGPDSFTFTVSDGSLTSAPATVSITVSPVADGPTALSQSVTTNEDTALNITLAGTDPDGGTLTFNIATPPTHGILTGEGAGRTYTPAANYSGPDSFTFTVSDGGITSAPATITITVSPVPDNPIATPQSLVTNEDTALGVTLLVTDPDGDIASFAVVSGPTNGALTGTAPNLTYTPGLNYNGPDSFTFTVTDAAGATSEAATVSITVSSVNDLPTASSQSQTTNEDSPLNITLTGSDPENGALTFTILTQPTNGSVTGGTGAARTYTPAANYFGADSFTFSVSDGTHTSSPATVSITVSPVNDAPVAVDDVTAGNEDTPAVLSQASLKGNDTDVDNTNAQLSVTAVNNATNGSVALNTDGTITFTPNPNFTGPAGFDYTLSDGALTDIGHVAINIAVVNDLPSATPQSLTTNEDTALNLTLAGTDPENTALTFNIVTPPAHGTLNAGSAEARTYTPASNYAGADSFTFTVTDAGGATSAPATVSITVSAVNDAPVAVDDVTSATEDTPANLTQAYLKGNDTDVDNTNAQLSVTAVSNPTSGTVVQNGDGSVTFTPAANFTGPAGFDYTLSDGALTDIGHVTINVSAVNDAPVATPQSVTTNEDTAASIILAGLDPEGTALTFSVGTPSHGTLSGTAPNLTYTPAANYFGPDSFTFAVTDAGGVTSALATVSITVNPVNDPPVATAQSVSTNEGVAASITLAASDTEGSALTFNVGTAAHGTLSGTAPNLTYTPAASYSGPDSFTFTVTDTGGATSAPATVSITVNTVNDVPSATPQSVTTNEDTPLNITLAGTDPENTALTFNVVTPPAHGTVGTGTAAARTYTPAANYFGADSFTFTVTDAGGATSAPATVSITVSAVNDAPVAVDDVTSATEDTPANLTQALLKGNDTDVDNTNAQLSVTAVSNPTNGTVVQNGDGSVTFTPAANFTGPAGFDYTVSDGTLSDVGRVTINVSAVNDAPTATPQTLATNEDTALGITLAGTDPENQALTFSIVSGPANGTLSGTGANRTFTPAANYDGPVSFMFTVSDGGLTSAPATVSITVNAVNDPPSISDIANQNTSPGTAVSAAFTVGDVESLATLNVSGTSNNQALIPDANIVITGTGASRTVTLTPAAGQTGSATISVMVNDGVVPAVDTFLLNVGLAGGGPTVQVLTPNGGERLFTRSAYVIQWNATAGSAALASFNVQYSTNNGTSFVAVPGCTGLGAAIRQCNWAAPVSTNTGRIRVIATDTASQTGNDVSDAAFTVTTTTPAITVSNPSGSSTMAVGSLRTITWTHNIGTAAFPASFIVEVSRNGTTGPWVVIATGVPQATLTTGRYDWIVAAPTSSNVRFRVRAIGFTTVGTNSSTFSIANPTMIIEDPNKGETLRIGTTYSFGWRTNLGNGETVKIEISRNAGATWELITAATPAGSGTGEYNWVVTGPTTTQLRGRVTWNRNPSLFVVSPGNNTIAP